MRLLCKEFTPKSAHARNDYDICVLAMGREPMIRTIVEIPDKQNVFNLQVCAHLFC